jgi:PAS domain S-box-containing protein
MTDFDDVLADDGVGLWSHDERSGLLTWSPAMFTLHGRDPARGVPDLADWLLQVAPHPGETDLGQLLRQGEAGTVVRTTFLLLGADGIERESSCTIRVRSAVPGARVVVGAMRDLAPMTRLAEDLATAQSLALIGNFRFDAASRRMTWSDELHQLLGCEPGELEPAPDTLIAYVAAEDREAFRQRLAEVSEGRDVERADTRFLRPNGEVRYAVGTIVIDRDSLGRFAGYRGALLDVTERVRIAESLRARTQELEAAQALASVGTWVFDTETGAVRWSDEMYRIHGLSPETFVPTIGAAYALVVPEDRDALERANHSLRSRPSIGPHNYRVKLTNGEIRHLVGAARVIRGPGEQGGVRILGTVLDVTSRVDLESMLLHVQKLEGLGRLAGGVAHDFNNVLTAILANADAAQLVPSSGVEEELHEITNAALHARELTRQLLTFARRDTSRAQQVAPSDVLMALSRTLGRLVGEEIRVELRYAPQRATVLVDPGRLEQVILNLAVNARDAMPKGGTLTMETSIVDLDRTYVARHVDATVGRFVRIDVRDTGTGMSEETKRRIFEPFFTTKSAGQGTGLGLATCYGVVRQAGGHLAVESQLGVGTLFSVFLPVANEGAVEQRASLAPKRRAGGSETILVAEDDLGVRRVLLRTLRALGYDVLEAVDGVDAIEKARAHAGPIHLLLSDVVMPRMRGPEAARTIRTLRPGIPVLFITGYAGEHTSTPDAGRISEPDRAIWDEGPVLGKPFTPDALAARVRALLDAAEG